MKRSITFGLLISALTVTTASFAQGTYDDDIYYNRKTAEQERPAGQAQPPKQYDYNSNGNGTGYVTDRQNEEEYDYVNYDEEYSYGTRINQFYHPFYNLPYWSPYYNPNWYNPYWSDPFWGWNPWLQPGYSFSFGFGGPYWSSYWGWQSWYGYAGFNSYWGYYGVGCGYYSGYWNGYYAGMYSPYVQGCYNSVTYGPRYSLNSPRNNYAHGVGYSGFRRQDVSTASQSRMVPASSPSGLSNDGVRRAPGSSSVRDMQNSSAETIAPIRSSSPVISRDDRGSFEYNRSPDAVSGRTDLNGRNEGRSQPNAAESVQPSRSDRRGLFSSRSEQSGSFESAQQPQQRNRGGWFNSRSDQSPRSSNGQMSQSQRSWSQPRMEQRSASPAPRMSAPSRSFGGSSGSRGFGGGGSFGGGGNSGGMRGGRR